MADASERNPVPRFLRRLALLIALAGLVLSSPASAFLGPNCHTVGVNNGFMYRGYQASPLKYDCSYQFEHGNWFGAYTNVTINYPRQVNSAVRCSTMTAQVIWGNSSGLYPGPLRSTTVSLLLMSSNVANSPGGVFASNVSASSSSWYESGQMLVRNLNC